MISIVVSQRIQQVVQAIHRYRRAKAQIEESLADKANGSYGERRKYITATHEGLNRRSLAIEDE